MKQQIKNRYSDKVIFECELPAGTKNPLREAVIKAVSEGVSLKSANLTGANLSSAKMANADLYSAALYKHLYSANLKGANLSSANLKGANLSSANLEGANLSSANLSGANLEGVIGYTKVSEAATTPGKSDEWMKLFKILVK